MPHKHKLVTPRERAAQLGFKPGHRVAFDFEGVRYHQFYVPLERLMPR
jgi:hypothetical protein